MKVSAVFKLAGGDLPAIDARLHKAHAFALALLKPLSGLLGATVARAAKVVSAG